MLELITRSCIGRIYIYNTALIWSITPKQQLGKEREKNNMAPDINNVRWRHGARGVHNGRFRCVLWSCLNKVAVHWRHWRSTHRPQHLTAMFHPCMSRNWWKSRVGGPGADGLQRGLPGTGRSESSNQGPPRPSFDEAAFWEAGNQTATMLCWLVVFCYTTDESLSISQFVA